MAKFAAAVILVSFVAVAMAGGYPAGYKEKSYESAPYMKPYESSYVEKKNYETPTYHAPTYNMKAYTPPQPSYQMKAKAYNPQPSYVMEKGYDNKYEKPKSYGSYSATY